VTGQPDMRSTATDSSVLPTAPCRPARRRTATLPPLTASDRGRPPGPSGCPDGAPDHPQRQDV